MGRAADGSVCETLNQQPHLAVALTLHHGLKKERRVAKHSDRHALKNVPLTRIARSAILVSILPAGLMQTRPPPGKAGSGPPTQLRCARKPASRLTWGQRDAG